MSENTLTKTKPEIEIDEQIIEELLSDVNNEAQVTVHCRYPRRGVVRIWKSTYLVPHNSAERSKLLHHENISLYPKWTEVESNGLNFTLIFSRLPKDCAVFDLIESIPEPGGFIVKNIKRNKSDVYFVEIY